ncbi:probable sarcosine oxidase [Humulus lupulus]|uniref:probable sarcosine oxidase n=1 Tax=Humulus lupulus TaxID=3486 RepID=UPI002B40F598|nr:probable sarcosine oxidase [Humulus lupulus]
MEYSTEEFDVIVIGAGVMGSSTAYQTARRGQKTLLLEQYDFLHHRGSSHGESRTIRATYPEDYYTDLVLESYALWEQAESEIGYKVYFKAHQFDMGPSDSKILRAVIASYRRKSLPHRALNSQQVAEQFSGRIQIPENWVGVYSDKGGVIKPSKAVSMFQTLALKNGAVLKDNSEVKEIKKIGGENDGVLVTIASGESFRGKKCVVTVGAWTRKLVKTVCGVELPIQPLETTVSYWRIKEGYVSDYAIDNGFPSFAGYGDPYICGTPSFEYPGLIKVGIHGGYPCDPDKRPWRPGMSLGAMKEWIQKRFSGRVDSSKPITTQLCMYSMTPDEDFVLDFLGGEFGKDVVMGGGFSGHGFKMAPAVARLLADLALTGETKGNGLKYFRIGRFVENPKGNVKEYSEEQINNCGWI